MAAADTFVVILAGLDLGVGVWHNVQDGKAGAAAAAVSGIFAGTSATVYFGALCMCWDDGLSPQRLLILLSSFLALVGSALLCTQLQCTDAPSE